MITSHEINSQFDIVLDSSSFINYPLEPIVLAELSLPYAHRLQVRQIVSVAEFPSDSGGVYHTFRIGYDVLLLNGTGTFPTKISVEINENFGRPDTVKCALSSTDSPVSLTVGQPLKIIVVEPSMELRLSKVKIIVTVHMDPNLMPPETTISVQNHLEQISTLIKSGIFADCKVVSRNGEEFACHKAILSLKSAVIQTAFEVEHMSEAKTGRIQLDCDSDVVKLLLRHFYTGEMPVGPDEILMELYGIAHLYQIESLKTQLADVIMLKIDKIVTIENVLNTVVFADKYDLMELSKFCLQFIIKNLPEITNQPEWNDFSSGHPDLVEMLRLNAVG